MNGFLDLKKAQKILQEYEEDAWNQNVKSVMSDEIKQNTITKTTINVIREIRDRLGIPEIKA